MRTRPADHQQTKKKPPLSLPVRGVRIFCTGLIRSYQLFLSPLFPAACRYTPTCSQYALDAIAEYGPFRGLLLSVGRILRCHPFAAGGYDPVRPKASAASSEHHSG